MKKFLAKLVLNLILALSLNSMLFLPTTFACSDWNNPSECLDSATECIDAEGDDQGKIVTILEEGLPGTEYKLEGEEFEIRTCYRHTIEHFGGGKSSIYAKLTNTSQKCFDELPPAPQKDGDNLKGSKYSCYEVQVVLSEGGTTLLFVYIGMVYRWGISIAGVIAVTVVVLSGIQISASGGDQEAITAAKNRIVKSFAGIAVLFLSGLILYTINPNFFVA